MSEMMIERVARGMHLRRPNSRLTKWEDCCDEYRTGTMRDARAAIEAMRTPTDDMKRQGWHELRKHNDIQTRLGNSLVGVETPTYQAMIDAALTR